MSLLPDTTMPAQLSLQGEDFWPPERPELVELVKSKRPLYTGKIRGKDTVLCRAVCIDVLMGTLSKRQIAAKYGIGRDTIDAITNLMRERGELRPLQEMIKDGLGECVMLMLLRLRAALLAGEFSPAQIPIAMSALIDKKAQLEAGIVPGTNISEGEAAEANLRGMLSARAAYERLAAAAESESVARSAQVPPAPLPDAPADGLVTPAATPTARLATFLEPPAGPTIDLERDPGQEGGGGVESAPPAPSDRWDGSQNFEP